MTTLPPTGPRRSRSSSGSTRSAGASAKTLSATPLAPRTLAALSGTRQALLVVEGEVGERELAHLIPRALALAEGGRRWLVLDLRRVTHWDYRCLPPLWTLALRLRARGGDLRLCAPNRYLTTILRFSGLEQLVEIHPNARAAAANFGGPAGRGGSARRRP